MERETEAQKGLSAGRLGDQPWTGSSAACLGGGSAVAPGQASLYSFVDMTSRLRGVWRRKSWPRWWEEEHQERWALDMVGPGSLPSYATDFNLFEPCLLI